MKLLRYGAPGAEKPGLLDNEGRIRSLDDFVQEIDGETLSPIKLAELAEINPETLSIVHGEHRIGPCVARPLNFICIGLNYADHAAESGLPLPKEPIIFIKSLSAYCGPNDDVKIPRGSLKTDWEVELGIVIGTKASYVSEREYQIERGGTWDKGKGCDTFGPTGPWMVTKDEIPDPQALTMWLDVDGERMQNGTTATMIFGVKTLVSYVSQFITLHPGDIISTGTPPGVGMGKKPNPIYLKAGQTIKLGISGLGEQTQKTIDA